MGEFKPLDLDDWLNQTFSKEFLREAAIEYELARAEGQRMDRLEEIEARWARTTPGPWEIEEGEYEGHPYETPDGPSLHSTGVAAEILGPDLVFRYATNGDCPSQYGGKDRINANAEAISRSPEDVAWLIAEVKRLRDNHA